METFHEASMNVYFIRHGQTDYSLKDFSETLAEAVEDFYMNGYGSSVLSRQIVKVLEEELT